jgi:hypothetical protein
MATTSLEERVEALESELAELKRQLGQGKACTDVPWWERIYGTFADSPDYEEAMRLGREYRESLRPKDDGD